MTKQFTQASLIYEVYCKQLVGKVASGSVAFITPIPVYFQLVRVAGFDGKIRNEEDKGLASTQNIQSLDQD